MVFVNIWSASNGLFKHSIWLIVSDVWSSPYGYFLVTNGVLHMVTICGHMESTFLMALISSVLERGGNNFGS